jgi:hypothetical protein
MPEPVGPLPDFFPDRAVNPPMELISIQGLAQLFNRSPESVGRAIDLGQFPAPIQLFDNYSGRRSRESKRTGAVESLGARPPSRPLSISHVNFR